MNRMSLTLLAAAATIVTAFPAVAQGTYKREIPDALAKKAKVTEDVAAKTAIARVPKGEIQTVELEEENGKLIYSYDIKVAGKSGIEEVNVDAITGAIVAHEHEDAAAEAKERKAEAKAKKKP
jgi:uncharacterized membrane protein YkoI